MMDYAALVIALLAVASSIGSWRFTVLQQRRATEFQRQVLAAQREAQRLQRETQRLQQLIKDEGS